MDEPSQPRPPQQPLEPPAQAQPDPRLVARWITLMVVFFGVGFLLAALFVYRETQRIKRIKEETEKHRPKAELNSPAATDDPTTERLPRRMLVAIVNSQPRSWSYLP